MANKVQFELVSPEKLLRSQPVDMVVVPGTDGLFGVLPGHALLISTVKAGVVEIYRDGAVTDRIFVSQGFADVTPERCTVLADEAVPLNEIDRAAVEAQIRDLRDEAADAHDDERAGLEARLAVAEAKLAALNTAA